MTFVSSHIKFKLNLILFESNPRQHNERIKQKRKYQFTIYYVRVFKANRLNFKINMYRLQGSHVIYNGAQLKVNGLGCCTIQTSVTKSKYWEINRLTIVDRAWCFYHHLHTGSNRSDWIILYQTEGFHNYIIKQVELDILNSIYFWNSKGKSAVFIALQCTTSQNQKRVWIF